MTLSGIVYVLESQRKEKERMHRAVENDRRWLAEQEKIRAKKQKDEQAQR